MNRLSLRARLSIWFAASLLLILTPVLAMLAVVQWRSMRAALDHHLEEDLEVAAEMLVVGPSGLEWRTNATRDLGYDGGPQRWVEVYEATGAPLFFRGLAVRPDIRAALPAAGRATAGCRTIRTPAGAFTRALTSERLIAGVPIWIRVVRSEDELREDLRRLILLFGLMAPLSVLGAALAGYVISARALSPLSRMAERARTISADRLSERLPVENPSDELGQLASVFNETFARLESSFDRLKRFTADASHQLRTPLTAIRSVGEVGLREAREPGDYQDAIGSMLEETDRLSNLVDTLLTLARWESGRNPRTPTQFDFGELARQAANQLAVLAEERDITVEVALDSALVVSADADMIRSALMNVVDNAIKFTPEGGLVRLWARTDGTSHHLAVDDTGPGIPVEHRTRVLERFHRIEGDPSRGTSRPGAGLGLAIADWAFAANRGRVLIDASDSGGTRVVLSLPRA